MSNRRRTPRRPGPSAHSGQGRALGLDDRNIPGGLEHLTNPETPSGKPKVPQRVHIPEMNLHSVPVDGNPEYDLPPEDEKILIPVPEKLPDEQFAVPVYMVETPGKQRVRRELTAETITVAAQGSEPTRVCGVDANRVEVSLLNVTASGANPAPIQFDNQRATVVEGRGAQLMNGATSYKALKTQGELFALSTTANPQQLSVIIETEVNV